MDYKNKFKKEIDDSMPEVKNLDFVKSKLNFKEKGELFFMKKNKAILVTSVVAGAVVLAGVGTGIGLALTSSSDKGETLVRMDVNPSISMVLDKNNKVISISGDNNEGKMIITGENIVGKGVEDAIKYLITIENETGYLVSGNLTVDTNNIQFSITTDNENIKKSIEDSISKAVDAICEKLDIGAAVEFVSSYTKEALIELVLLFDPTKDRAELEKMSSSELIDIIKEKQRETISLCSEELEDLYYQIKDYKIDIASSEYTKELISSLGEAYQFMLDTYQSALSTFESYIEQVNEYRYNAFVAEDSEYQQYLSTMQDKKQEVIALKNEIASLEDSAQKDLIISQLEASEEALNQYIELLENSKTRYLATLDTYISSLERVSSTLTDIYTTLLTSDVFKDKVNQSVAELDKRLNSAKDKAFEEFEKLYKDIIEKTKEEAVTYKNELKAKVAEAKSK